MVEELLQQIKAAGGIPRHVAIIMDGNGRWARERGLPRILGHREGMKSVRAVTEAAAQAGIEILTLFAFSKENWRRPSQEVEALMDLLEQYAESEREELIQKGIRVVSIGDLHDLRPSAQEALQSLVATTTRGTRMVLNLALSYSGRWDILEAARRMAQLARQGRLVPEDLQEATFAQALSTRDWPDPDLLIRTSGEMRVSNFMLWQLAYTELYITDVLWPGFREEDFLRAVLDYQRRERRFGGVPSWT